jgi:[ribosomal protein S5]-alanine N-acetyltransferase
MKRVAFLIRTPRLELSLWSPEFMRASLTHDLIKLRTLAGVQLPDDFPGGRLGLIKMRLSQIERNPLEHDFLLRSIVFEGSMIGAIGFHAMPDARGRLEVGYEIFPEFKRRGFALEAVQGLLDWAKLEPGVKTFAASVSPTNTASLRLISKLGFKQIGRQWDDQDGEELVFELQA